jgi:hypothetical protein
MRNDVAKPTEPRVEPLELGADYANLADGVTLHMSSVAKLRLICGKRQILLRWTIIDLAISLLPVFPIPRWFKSVARLMLPPDQMISGIAMRSVNLQGELIAMKS